MQAVPFIYDFINYFDNFFIRFENLKEFESIKFYFSHLKYDIDTNRHISKRKGIIFVSDKKLNIVELDENSKFVINNFKQFEYIFKIYLKIKNDTKEFIDKNKITLHEITKEQDLESVKILNDFFDVDLLKLQSKENNLGKNVNFNYFLYLLENELVAMCFNQNLSFFDKKTLFLKSTEKYTDSLISKIKNLYKKINELEFENEILKIKLKLK